MIKLETSPRKRSRSVRDVPETPSPQRRACEAVTSPCIMSENSPIIMRGDDDDLEKKEVEGPSVYASKGVQVKDVEGPPAKRSPVQTLTSVLDLMTKKKPEESLHGTSLDASLWHVASGPPTRRRVHTNSTLVGQVPIEPVLTYFPCDFHFTLSIHRCSQKC